MLISLSSKSDLQKPTIIALFEGQKPDAKILGNTLTALVETALQQKTFSTDGGKSTMSHRFGEKEVQKLLFVGLGKESEFSDLHARNTAAKIIKAAKSWEESQLHIVLPSQILAHLRAFAEGLIMGNYDPALHKTGKDAEEKKKKMITSVSLISDRWGKNHQFHVQEGQQVGETVNFVRHLVNAPPNILNTDTLVSEARAIAKKNKYHFTDFTKAKLEKMKMGGILAVNRGSKDPAHLVMLEHRGAKEDPVVLIGKGIIFDTGGVNLKPTGSLHEMHMDMSGAAAVLGVFQLLKKLNIKRHVIGLVPITDNAIDANAYRPSEVITTYSGKTVEINNTDAEGRMILCDAIAYAVKHLKPKYVIDIATLTGACVVGLGYRTAGLFGNDEQLAELLKESGKRTDEALCQLPITDADESSIKGKVADLTNLADVPYGGACRAAAFLKEFVDKKPWAHLDIAGPAHTKEPKPYEVNMGTGFGVRLLIDFLQKL